MDEKTLYLSEKDILRMLNESNGFAIYEFIQILGWLTDANLNQILKEVRVLEDALAC